MTSALDLADLRQEILGCILHESPCSVNVIVPPGFDDQYVGDSLVEALSTGAAGRPIARLTMDELPDAATFVRRLAEGLDLPAPAPGDPSRALERLLLHHEQPALYVLQKFHRTLDVLPAWLLAHLRSAEQAGRARAIVISHASHARLKRRWRTKGHPLVVSDYGDTHIRRVVRLFDTDQIGYTLRDQIPPSVQDFVLTMTGGYPEILHKMLAQWPPSSPDRVLHSTIRRQLMREATHDLSRLVDWLEDDEGDTYYQRAIIDLYHGREKEQARAALHDHELRQLLLDGDGELRARALAHAALRRERERLLRHADTEAIIQRARALYLRADYEHAHQLLARSSQAEIDAQLLLRHAQIMTMMTDIDPTLDIDWQMLASVVSDTASVVEKASLDETGELQRRYDGLLQIAQIVAKAERPRDLVELVRDHRYPPYETDGRESARAALLISAQCICNAGTLPSNAGVLRYVLGLPEQLFRIWAWWTLELDHASAPALDSVRSQNSSGWGRVAPKLPQPGERFTSFRTFAMFGVALLEQRGQLGDVPWLELSTLERDLELLDDICDASHHSTSHRRTLCKRYLSLCHRWFRAVLGAAGTSIGEHDRNLLVPLPLSEGGEHLDWSICSQPEVAVLFEEPSNSPSVPLASSPGRCASGARSFEPLRVLHLSDPDSRSSNGDANLVLGRQTAEMSKIKDEEEVLFTWLHLSDLHFGHGDSMWKWNQEIVLTELENDIVTAANRPLEAIDAVLVTGDIAFSGGALSKPTYDEYGRAAEWFNRVIRAIGLTPEKLYAVPGNHDVQRRKGGDVADALVETIRKGNRTIDAALDDNEYRAIIEARQAAYMTFASGFAKEHKSPWWSVELERPQGLKIRLIGWNTALLCMDDEDQGKLALGQQQLLEVVKHGGSGELVIVMTHHPFDEGWLSDQKEIAGMTRRNSHLHLCGHTHDAEFATITSGSGASQVRVVAASTHVDAQEKEKTSHGYNFGQFIRKNEGYFVRIRPRIYRKGEGGFVVDMRLLGDGMCWADHPIILK